MPSSPTHAKPVISLIFCGAVLMQFFFPMGEEGGAGRGRETEGELTFVISYQIVSQCGSPRM